jgi:hypothetical protein
MLVHWRTGWLHEDYGRVAYIVSDVNARFAIRE